MASSILGPTQHGRAGWPQVVVRAVALASFSALLACGALAVATAGGTPDPSVRVRSDLTTVARDLERYRTCHGDWPGGFAELYGQTPLDPWGHPYVLAPPVGARARPDVLALGADGWPGGEGWSGDLWMSEVVADADLDVRSPDC